MILKRVILCLALLALAACGHGTAEKPPYPGIKLGKPYEVYGNWYKPHYNADYDEVGVASWYGPGFNGGHTASGERFDENAMTAAHKTLPLPSIVRVTNLDNGLSAIIKINDRGPFAHSRIIDLSKASARKLGVIATGTAKVRVQFLERETREYVENLNSGTNYAMRELKKVDPEEAGAREEASNQPVVQMETKKFGNVETTPGGTAPSAQDQIISLPSASNIVANNTSATSEQAPSYDTDEFSMVDNTGAASSPPVQYTPFPAAQVSHKPVNLPASADGYFIRAGTFAIEENARKLIDKLSDDDAPQAMELVINGKKFYRVMLGPYTTSEDAKNMLSKLTAMGISDAKIIRN